MTMRKRARTSLDSAIVDVWKREVGALSTRNFAHRLAASEDLVLRLDILRKLDKHRGCVNTVSFNAAGDILVSGSDDRKVIFWDWESGQSKFSFHSGHHNNVFQAKIMPSSDDRSIVTCAADGQVRHAQIAECEVETKLVARHQGRVHKLAIEPGSPHIVYTCGEDGLVQHIDLRTGSPTCLFTCRPLPSQNYFSTIHLNSITIDPRNPNLLAVGGADQFARLFDIRQYSWDASSKHERPVDYFCPPHLIDDDNVGITGLAFSDQSELLVSYNDEFIYLFTRYDGLGPDPAFMSQISDGSDAGDMTMEKSSGTSISSDTGNVKGVPQAYKGHRNCETVKGVNFFGPKCEYVVSGSDCGRIFIWRKKGGDLVRVMEADKNVVNCIEPHPHATMLASSGIEHDIKIWVPKAIDRATLPTNIQKDRVMNLIPRRIAFFPFDGFYDDDDDGDFICSDDDDDDDDDDEDEDEDEGEDDDDDDDDDDNNDDGDNCVNCDYSPDDDNDEQLEEEEDSDEDDSTDFTSIEDFDGNDDLTDNYFDDEELVGGTGESENGDNIDNATADDSLVDICDVDDYSDFGGGDFDD